jgi:hypothetical protein
VFKLVTLAQQVRLTGAATGGSVKPVLISTPVNIYSAVNQYSRVSWWERADVILPMLGVCLVYAMLSTLAWILAALWRVVGRRRPTGRRRLIDIVGDGELVLVSQLVAIVAAIWLVTAGAPYAAVASRAATAVTLGVSVTSWLGVLAVPLVVRGAFLGWRHASSSRRRRVQHSLTATVATALAAFSLYWRVAGL